MAKVRDRLPCSREVQTCIWNDSKMKTENRSTNDHMNCSMFAWLAMLVSHGGTLNQGGNIIRTCKVALECVNTLTCAPSTAAYEDAVRMNQLPQYCKRRKHWNIVWRKRVIWKICRRCRVDLPYGIQSPSMNTKINSEETYRTGFLPKLNCWHEKQT